tara:strand:+ start:634 stop:939 length:306 start_codon:yes stop_codon:yes gene_type:complete
MNKYARKCDATGIGMNEGFVVGDGELYFSKKQHLIEYLRGVDWEDSNGVSSSDMDTDDDLMDYFYNEEFYYYTEWEEIDDEIYPVDSSDVYYDEDGNEYEL